MSSPVRSRGSLRGKVMAGGAIGLLALGIWIGSLLPGLGLGLGLGGGPGVDEAGDSRAELDGDPPVDARVAVDLGTPGLAPTQSPPRGDVAPAATVTVMIYGDSFRLARDPAASVASLTPPASDHFNAASLEEVVARAEQAQGNPEGIKVLVLAHRTATVGAEQRLRKALQAAGIRNEETHRVVGSHD